jgi:hypothetical protein
MAAMRTATESTKNVLVVCDEEERLSLESVEGFSAWIDGQLDGLVERWSHLAAPNAALREIFGNPR